MLVSFGKNGVNTSFQNNQVTEVIQNNQNANVTQTNRSNANPVAEYSKIGDRPIDLTQNWNFSNADTPVNGSQFQMKLDSERSRIPENYDQILPMTHDEYAHKIKQLEYLTQLQQLYNVQKQQNLQNDLQSRIKNDLQMTDKMPSSNLIMNQSMKSKPWQNLQTIMSHNLNTSMQAVPAGRPSYSKYQDNHEESKVVDRNISKWRSDENVYEANRPNIKINRKSTEDLHSVQKVIDEGMQHPRWWGDASNHKDNIKAKPSIARNDPNQVREDKNNDNIKNDGLGRHEAELKAIREEYQQRLADKRAESMPKKELQERIAKTNPLKSVLRNSKTIKAPGGVAMHFPSSENAQK